MVLYPAIIPLCACLNITTKKLSNRLRKSLNPMIICVPSQTTDVEREQSKGVPRCGAARTFIISEPLAAAIGAGIDISKPTGNMIVDVGRNHGYCSNLLRWHCSKQKCKSCWRCPDETMNFGRNSQSA